LDFIRKLKLLKYKNNPYFKKFYKEPEKDIKKAVFTSFDLETTGLDVKKDEIISIGAVKIKNLQIDLSTKFYKVVKPEKKLEKENVLIHGITQDEIENAPSIEKVLPEFLKYIKGTILIGYFVKFDIDMISKYTKKFYGFPILNPYIDIAELYQKSLIKSYKQNIFSEKNLDELAKEFGIIADIRHDAFYDSLISALVFLAIIKRGVNPL
jgi:DNA polymerase-3 subunit epsilon